MSNDKKIEFSQWAKAQNLEVSRQWDSSTKLSRVTFFSFSALPHTNAYSILKLSRKFILLPCYYKHGVWLVIVNTSLCFLNLLSYYFSVNIFLILWWRLPRFVSLQFHTMMSWQSVHESALLYAIKPCCIKNKVSYHFGLNSRNSLTNILGSAN